MKHDWNKILNWKLLDGSHAFPGPDGGTCINEAAVVVAGFPYRSVSCITDLPECFCPILSFFALRLNDLMKDNERQSLIPFVPRLAGTADPAHKFERAGYIYSQVSHRVVPILLESHGVRITNTYDAYEYVMYGGRFPSLIKALQTLIMFTEESPLRMISNNFPYKLNKLSSFLKNALIALEELRDVRHELLSPLSYKDLTSRTLSQTVDIKTYRVADEARREILQALVEILDGAMKIGKQAPEIEVSIIKERVEKAKTEAKEKANVSS